MFFFHQIIPYEASLTLALPPDTDTPGFHEEEKTKPEITRIISETVALTKPEVVAEKILEDTLVNIFKTLPTSNSLKLKFLRSKS